MVGHARDWQQLEKSSKTNLFFCSETKLLFRSENKLFLFSETKLFCVVFLSKTWNRPYYMAVSYHEVNVQPHHMQLVLHGATLVEVVHQERHSWQTHAWAVQDAFPQSCVEEWGVCCLTKLFQKHIRPGTRIRDCMGFEHTVTELYTVVHSPGP